MTQKGELSKTGYDQNMFNVLTNGIMSRNCSIQWDVGTGMI